MVPFDFHPRTRVVFGPGSITRVGPLARDLGFRRTLLVADPGIQAAGHATTVSDHLTAEGLETFLFDGFGVNPDSAMVDAGVRFATGLSIDSIVAVGGGSSLDCAKGINFILRNGGTIADYRGYGKATTPLRARASVPAIPRHRRR